MGIFCLFLRYVVSLFLGLVGYLLSRYSLFWFAVNSLLVLPRPEGKKLVLSCFLFSLVATTGSSCKPDFSGSLLGNIFIRLFLSVNILFCFFPAASRFVLLLWGMSP